MSVIIGQDTYLECDEFGCRRRSRGHPDQSEAVKIATFDGWWKSQTSGRVLCPDCRNKPPAELSQPIPKVSPEDVDTEAAQRILNVVRDAYIAERVRGFTNVKTGQFHPPIPKAEAEQRWTEKVEPKYRAVIFHPDEDLADKHHLRKKA